jgi:hypothetical protein
MIRTDDPVLEMTMVGRGGERVPVVKSLHNHTQLLLEFLMFNPVDHFENNR